LIVAPLEISAKSLGDRKNHMGEKILRRGLLCLLVQGSREVILGDFLANFFNNNIIGVYLFFYREK
jgi:hypothetical protein